MVIFIKNRIFSVISLLSILALSIHAFDADVDQKLTELKQLAEAIKVEVEAKTALIKNQSEIKVPLSIEPFNVDHFTKLQTFSEYFASVNPAWREICSKAVEILIGAIDDTDLIVRNYLKDPVDTVISNNLEKNLQEFKRAEESFAQYKIKASEKANQKIEEGTVYLDITQQLISFVQLLRSVIVNNSNFTPLQESYITVEMLKQLEANIKLDLDARLTSVKEQRNKNKTILIEPLDQTYLSEMKEYSYKFTYEPWQSQVIPVVNMLVAAILSIETDLQEYLNNPKNMTSVQSLENSLKECVNSQKVFKKIQETSPLQVDDSNLNKIAASYYNIAEKVVTVTRNIEGEFVLEKYIKTAHKKLNATKSRLEMSVLGTVLYPFYALMPWLVYSNGQVTYNEMAIITSIFFTSAVTTGIFTSLQTSDANWSGQLKKLHDQNSKLDREKQLYLGIPSDDRNKIGKVYLLSKSFSTIADKDNNNHYEIYLMPKDKYAADLFLAINEKFKDLFYQDKIAFLGIRPTPGVTKSPYNGKNLPRIIIGLAADAEIDTVSQLIEEIEKTTVQKREGHLLYGGSQLGLNVQPRYSKKYNDLIYTAYGSADFKDSDQFKKTAEGQAIYNKKGRTWSEWWYGPTDEDMAYPDKSKDPLIQDLSNNSNS